MKEQRGKYLIRAKVREMAASEIVGHIGNDRYQEIKDSDDHPYFFGATVAHEGVSTGKVVGQGSTEKHWPAAAIASLTRKINESAAPVFLGHGGGSRPSYGTVISAFSENGKAQAVSHIEDSGGKNSDLVRRISEGELNTVSVEADLLMEVEDDGRLTVIKVDQVTGLALADSRWERPGFEGARVLASVQEFESDEGNEPEPQEEEKEVKLSDIVAAIREGGYRPDQIFQKDELLGAEPVKTALSAAQQETEKAQAAAKSAAEEKAKLATANEELSGKLSGYESSGLVADQIKAAKLTEKQAQYVDKQLEGYTPQGETEEARQQAVDAAIKQHTETFEQFFPGGKSSDTGGTTDSVGGEDDGDATDMADPENNPAIPGSTAKME